MASPTQTLAIYPVPVWPNIVLALTYRLVPLAEREPGPLRFHWMIYVPDKNDWTTGIRLHPSAPSGVWQFEATQYSLPYAKSLAAAAVIGTLREGFNYNHLYDILSQIPTHVPEVDYYNEPRFTARVWAREALRRLHNAGFINCPYITVMEAEMMFYGEGAVQAMDAEQFTQAQLRRATHST